MLKNSVYMLMFLLVLVSCDRGGKEAAQNGADTTTVTLDQLNKLIAGDESNPELYERRARFYMKEKQMDLALRDANKAVSLSAKAPYYITLSDVYMLMGQPQNAQGVLNRALESEPENIDLLLALANFNLIVREYKTAISYVKKSLEVEPVNNPRAYFIRSLILLENGDTVGAVNDLKKSASLDQNNFEAFLQLGELYSMKKDPIAADYLKNALRVRPNDKEALYLLGMFYQETGKYQEAIATYDSLKAVDSSYKNVSYNEGYVYLVYLKDFSKAVEAFSEAIEKDPLYAEAWFNRGYAYELAGDIANARKNYKRTLELKVNYDKAIEAMNRLDRSGQ